MNRISDGSRVKSCAGGSCAYDKGCLNVSGLHNLLNVVICSNSDVLVLKLNSDS